MFTGIIEEIGKVERIQKDTCNCKLSIKASKILEDIHLGDSIACLLYTSITCMFSNQNLLFTGMALYKTI